MPAFLLKTEPSDYSFAELAREKRCVWTGVTNAAARIHLRAMKKGDEVFVYHTGDEKAIVGLARVVRGAYEDPARPGKNPRGEPDFPVVDLACVRAAANHVPLARIKGDPRMKGFQLVTHSRLSVIPVPAPIERVLRECAGL